MISVDGRGCRQRCSSSSFPSGNPIVSKEEPVDEQSQSPIPPSGFPTCIKIHYYHFLLPKLDEEEQEAKLQAVEIAGLRNPNDPCPLQHEVKEIRPLRTPITLPLFPWEIRRTLTLNEVGFQHSRLELNHEQVEDHVFKYWDEDKSESMRLGEQVPIG